MRGTSGARHETKSDPSGQEVLLLLLYIERIDPFKKESVLPVSPFFFFVFKMDPIGTVRRNDPTCLLF